MTTHTPLPQQIDVVFQRLGRSRFRRRFRLSPRELDYLVERGLPEVIDHARQFLATRLAPAKPKNDGRQTPWHGHPAFVAQHATGTCCRSCLARWHQIQPGRSLSGEEIEYILQVLARWLGAHRPTSAPRQMRMF